MWLKTTIQITLLCLDVCKCWKLSPLSYIDNNYTGFDLYFDRMVALTLNISNWEGNGSEKVNVATGVMISSDQILTSYNPFRTIVQNKTLWDQLFASVLDGRFRSETGSIRYHHLCKSVACARQVQFLPDEAINKNHLWHGTNTRNCPLHDLMVIRILGNIDKISTLNTSEHTITRLPASGSFLPGVFLTKLATRQDYLGESLKYCELQGRFQLYVTEFDLDDNAVIDCDEWLPRNWGYFICILNKNKSPTLASGAMLVSNEKLFGVGGFVFFREDQSILVFTDVRFYYELIFETCTYSDSETSRPSNFPPDPKC